jgi:hypothetical protein
MDARELIQRLQASRERMLEAAGATFRVALPTDHAWRTTIEAHRNAEGLLQEAKAFRAILDAAIIGWEGVTAALLLGEEGGDEPLPFSPDARAALLDHRQDIADQIVILIADAMRTRRKQRETQAKN